MERPRLFLEETVHQTSVKEDIKRTRGMLKELFTGLDIREEWREERLLKGKKKKKKTCWRKQKNVLLLRRDRDEHFGLGTKRFSLSFSRCIFETLMV